MTIKIKYTHTFPTWELFRMYGVQNAYPKMEFCVECYTSDSKNESYDCAIILDIEGHYYCSGSCMFDLESIDFDIEDKEELSFIKDELRSIISLSSIKEAVRGTICENSYEQIYESIVMNI